MFARRMPGSVSVCGTPTANFAKPRTARQLRKQIGESGSNGCKPRPFVDPSKRIRVNWTNSSFPVVRQEFGFVGGHVHVDRAVAFAAFACQTKVERFLDMFIAPSIADHVAMHHLPEQVGPAAGRVHFFARDHVAWAHSVLRAFAVFTAAFSHSHTTQCGMREAAMIVGKLEIGGRIPGMVISSEPQVFIDAIGIDNLSRIHLPVWIPDRS